jgi:hypothetical protein
MPIGRVHLILEHHHDSWMPLKFNTFETQFECKCFIFNFKGPYVLRLSFIFNESKCIRCAKKRVKLFLWTPLWFVDPLEFKNLWNIISMLIFHLQFGCIKKRTTFILWTSLWFVEILERLIEYTLVKLLFGI